MTNVGYAVKDRLYVDGIESISVVEGIARLEMFVFKPGEKKEGQSAPEHLPAGELVMSLNGLARLHDGIGRLIEDMKKRQSAAKEAAGSENFPSRQG